MSAPCEHENFRADVDVIRLTDKTETVVFGYTADIRVRCIDCEEPFTFIGLPMGSLPSEPACNLDGTEARMPLRPLSAPDYFGLNLPGFVVRQGRPNHDDVNYGIQSDDEAGDRGARTPLDGGRQ